MRLRLSLVLLTALPLAVLPSFAAVAEPVVNDQVSDQYHPLAFDRQDLSGILAARMRANIEGYLEPMGKSATPIADWGGYLDAAANSFDYTHDRTLGVAMTKVAQSALAASAGTGKINRSQLLGLLSYYRVTGNEAALSKCKELGNAILAEPPATDSLESLITLYRYSGDRRYFDYCRKLIQVLYPPNVTRPLTATNSEDELSQLLGLTEFYRVTGEDAFLQAAITAWHQIRDGRLTATGTLSDTVDTPDSACVTLEWMQLTLDLFRITGEPQYADALEKTSYNQLLAQQDFRTGTVFTRAPLNGAKDRQPANTCATSVARGISILPALIWGHYGHGISVNFYAPGHATVRLHRGATVNLYEETSFPESGQVLLHVEPDHKIRFPLRFPLRLRVPEWADTFTVTAGGRDYTGRHGQYLVIKQQWKRGDTVAINMGIPVKLVHASTNNVTTVAIQRGPQILSLSKELNPQIGDISKFSFPVENVSQETLTGSPNLAQGELQGDQIYSVKGSAKEPLVFIPFADAKTYRTTFPSAVQSSALD
jgi:hypothetical protein